MELRSAVSVARQLVQCVSVRQLTLLPLSSTISSNTLNGPQSGHRDHGRHRHCLAFHSSHSTSYGGARLTMKMLSCRRDVLSSTSRIEASCLPCEACSSGAQTTAGCTVVSVRGMAGHSKWSNIRHIKAAKDNEKARVIHEYARKIRAFIRETGQTDPKTSSQLARLMAEAKSKNVPNANIDRVLTQMKGLKNSAPVMFAAKGPAGSVMLVEAITGKMNQTRAELQSIVKKCGFSMFDSGSLAKMCFEEKGVVQVTPQTPPPDLEEFVDIAIEAGAEDVTMEEDGEGNTVLQFVCGPGEVYSVKKELEGRSLEVSSAEVVYNATSTVTLDTAILDLVAKALEKLDEHPDVLRVYINVEEASS